MDKEYEKHEMEIINYEENEWIVTSGNVNGYSLGMIDSNDEY